MLRYLKATLFLAMMFFLLGLATLPTLWALIAEQRLLGDGPEALIGVIIGHVILGGILYFVCKSGKQEPDADSEDEGIADAGAKVMLIYVPLAGYAAGMAFFLFS